MISTRHKYFFLLLLSIAYIHSSDIDTVKLKLAWELSKKSKATNVNNRVKHGLDNVSYYSLKLPAYKLALDGERPWDVRWNIIKKTGIRFDDKNILEIGCNMGLLSTYLCYEFRPKNVVGFDQDPVVIDCANLIAQAYHVSPKLLCLELTTKNNWQCILGYDYDIVFLLSVFKYFNADEKKVFTEFLKKCNNPLIVYEGDKHVIQELATLRSCGYNDVKKIGISERKRPMFIVKKI